MDPGTVRRAPFGGGHKGLVQRAKKQDQQVRRVAYDENFIVGSGAPPGPAYDPGHKGQASGKPFQLALQVVLLAC